MTKEEALNKHDTSRHYIEQTCRPELFAAMDEWAKQQAIAFNRFINSKYDQHGGNFVSKISADNQIYFHDELYRLFIEQQDNQCQK